MLFVSLVYQTDCLSTKLWGNMISTSSDHFELNDTYIYMICFSTKFSVNHKSARCDHKSACCGHKSARFGLKSPREHKSTRFC